VTTWLEDRFRDYYTQAALKGPHLLNRREFAFITFGEERMQRHLTVKTPKQLMTMVQRRTPAHVYYSSAYYEKPAAPTMTEKGWLGADLIFDLDADHLPGTHRLNYEGMLHAVKGELIKLLDFLQQDFGFTDDELAVYFSGGRGYHCHVANPQVQPLGSQERREIVDYITGRGLDTRSILHEKTVFRQGNITQTSLEMPLPTEPGWRGKISREIITFFQSLQKMSKEDACAHLMAFEGIGPKTAEGIYAGLTEKHIERMRRGKFDQLPYITKIAPHLLAHSAVKLRGEPDEPVTADVKRLIRLPGSLHGKTGLKVAHIPLDGIEAFDPLSDAIVFDDSPVTVRLQKAVTMTMNQHTFVLKPGRIDVPTYLATLLVGRRLAQVHTR
jgi:DNA primase small subunit